MWREQRCSCKHTLTAEKKNAPQYFAIWSLSCRKRCRLGWWKHAPSFKNEFLQQFVATSRVRVRKRMRQLTTYKAIKSVAIDESPSSKHTYIFCGILKGPPFTHTATYSEHKFPQQTFKMFAIQFRQKTTNRITHGESNFIEREREAKIEKKKPKYCFLF